MTRAHLLTCLDNSGGGVENFTCINEKYKNGELKRKDPCDLQDAHFRKRIPQYVWNEPMDFVLQPDDIRKWRTNAG